MPEITAERTGVLLRKLFEILINAQSALKAQDALTRLKNNVEPTTYEKGVYPAGGVRFDKIVRFATIDCVKAGWLLKNRGFWLVTPEGISAYQKYSSPENFFRQAQKLYREWKKQSRFTNQPIEEQVAEESVSLTFEEAEEQAWNEIDCYLKNMPPFEFQNLVAALLKAMGYHVSWISPPGKDGGIDILAWNDPLGTRPPRIKVQVKREQNPTNVITLRSFMALLGDSDVGLFVSTGGFTKDAEDEARTQQRRQVTLVNSPRLFELWVENLRNLDDEAKDFLPLKPIYYLSPNG